MTIRRLLVLFGVAAALLAAESRAETVVPAEATYEFEIKDDLNARACHLALFITHRPDGEAVTVRFLVSRSKTNGILLGPGFAGFTLHAGNLPPNASKARVAAATFTAPGFASARSFGGSAESNGGFTAGTLDGPTARAYLAALFRGGYELAFTRDEPVVTRSYRIAEAPSAQLRAQFDACLVSLDA